MGDLNLGLPLFESFLHSLNIPESCLLNKPLFKKMFQENGDLGVADRSALKEDVEKVRWLYALKPDAINIPPFKNEDYEYPEVEVLHVSVLGIKRIKRIAGFINKAIPYPLIILFTHCESDHEQLAIAVSEKRINKADNEKWVVSDPVISGWISLGSERSDEAHFLRSLSIENLSFTNFKRFYESWFERIVAVKCAEKSGSYHVGREGGGAPETRLEKLTEIERLNDEQAGLLKKLQKERQLGRQIEINTKVKKIKDDIESIKKDL